MEDLKADIVNIDISILSLDSRQEKAKTLLTNLLKVQNDKTILIKDYISSIRSTRFVSTRAAIEDITSSGKLEILKNDAIKSAILKFYTHQDNLLTVITDNYNQLSQHIFDYITYTDFGLHEVPLYKEVFGEELQQLLKSTEWQKDPSSNLFINVKDHMNMTVIICEREKALLREMKESANQLKDLLESYCISND